jgi:glutathione synthase
MAIKCPPIPLQLAGSKKVQQVLTQAGVLERFLCNADKWGTDYAATKAEIDEIRDSWMEMWALDDDGVTLDEDVKKNIHLSNGVSLNGFHSERLERDEGMGMRKARANFSSLVLKPQREGGGNNVYRSAIPSFLDGLTMSERRAWIAMALIVPPERQMCYFVRPVAGKEERLCKVEVANELGIFGWTLFGEGRVRDEREVGWLVRTKRVDSDEGGISVGCSVLDSLILVDG